MKYGPEPVDMSRKEEGIDTENFMKYYSLKIHNEKDIKII